MSTFQISFLCKASKVSLEYFVGCNYFWLLVEAIFLHTLLFTAVLTRKRLLKKYMIIGWGATYPYYIRIVCPLNFNFKMTLVTLYLKPLCIIRFKSIHNVHYNVLYLFINKNNHYNICIFLVASEIGWLSCV